VVAFGRRALVFGASVPDRRVPARAGLGHPSESPVDQGGDAGGVQDRTHARDLQQLVLMAAPGPATVTPQQIAVDGRQRHAPISPVGAPTARLCSFRDARPWSHSAADRHYCDRRGPDSVRQPAGRRLSRSGPPQVTESGLGQAGPDPVRRDNQGALDRLARHAWQAHGRHDRHTVHDYLPPGDLGAMDGHDRYTGTPRVGQDLGGYFIRPP
jgi:hypothetical protein